jgi:ribosomal protein L7Ae-like RNA K-turn-binding protein
MLPLELTGLLGLAQRAGKVVIGSTAVSHELRRSRAAPLVLFAVDFSSSARARLLAKAATPPKILTIGTMAEWGAFFGRQQVGVIAIVDKNFATGILQKVTQPARLAKQGSK